MWNLATAQWRYHWLAMGLCFGGAFGLWAILWRFSEFAVASFNLTLWAVSLIPYMIYLAWVWRTHVHEGRERLQAQLPMTRSQLAGADMLTLLLPWLLAACIGLFVVLASAQGMERHGEYRWTEVWFSWAGKSLLLSAVLLFAGQRLGHDRALSLVVLLGTLHIGIDPILVVGANVVGAEPYVLNRQLHQMTNSLWGGLTYFALAGVLLRSYLQRAGRRDPAQ